MSAPSITIAEQATKPFTDAIAEAEKLIRSAEFVSSEQDLAEVSTISPAASRRSVTWFVPATSATRCSSPRPGRTPRWAWTTPTPSTITPTSTPPEPTGCGVGGAPLRPEFSSAARRLHPR